MCEDALVEPENKLLGYVQSNDHVTSLSVGSSIRTIDKNIISSSYSLLLHYRKPFSAIFNELILNLMSGGIFNHWNEMFNKNKIKFKLARSRYKQVLTMDFMRNLLLICSAPLILSFIAFGFEIKFKF